jgi:hypothetical protein
MITFAIVAASGAFLWIVQRVWSTEHRRQHNDLIGWQVTVVGTTYAVILGFMLYTVWTNFLMAEGNVEGEANCLVNLARSAKGLPSAQRQEIQDLARQYVDIVLANEWPAMQSLRFSDESHRSIQRLWAAVMKTEVHTASEQTSLDHALTDLTEMTNFRRLRQLEVISSLPGILWAVLIVGATVTIGSACLFGSADSRLHLIQVIMLAVLLSLALVAVADINRPFQGAVHVSSAGFARAREALTDLAAER